MTVAEAAMRSDPTAGLPPFPWDTIARFKEQAEGHPDGLVNLSVGAPVDKVPVAVRTALADASNSPGYPQVHGTDELRGAYSAWLDRAHGVHIDPADVLPTIGSKELVASLPGQLGFGAGCVVAIPELAYPTYEVGVRLAGATLLRTTIDAALTRSDISMLWLNSPSNPTGAVVPADQLARIVKWARCNQVIVASDECYLDLGWDATPLSILDPEVCGDDHTGLIALHSLSKRSNLAGYRVGFATGDPTLVAELTALRKHLGLIVPTPVQAAGVAALSDDAPIAGQRSRYAERRDVLWAAFERAGFAVDHSEAGLYLWCSRGESAVESVARLAEIGILVAPGTFYGPAGSQHIRVALTATDDSIARAVTRLATL